MYHFTHRSKSNEDPIVPRTSGIFVDDGARRTGERRLSRPLPPLALAFATWATITSVKGSGGCGIDVSNSVSEEGVRWRPRIADGLG